ncbi:MAG: IPT/TIG domain-containing protein [Bryobacterales bacterium]|nr:IPT/TIG domain-containing protein [Bryobacterales bacterium]
MLAKTRRAALRLIAVLVCSTLTASLAIAQWVSVSPELIAFSSTAYTPLDPESPPSRFVGLRPSPFGVESVPFRFKAIEPQDLPTGKATNFVLVSPSAGITTARTQYTTIISLNRKVVPYMLPGYYELYVLIENPERPDLGAGRVRVQLSLQSPGPPELTFVLNAASMQPVVSPGQLVTIRGAHLSSPPVTTEADSAGLFPKTVSDTRVTFNGTPAPLLYVSNNQINCVAPYSLTGAQAQVVVDRLRYSGLIESSNTIAVPVQTTSPAIFTADQTGTGPGAILNTGAGTGYNDQANPAPAGTAITFYATGAGAWNVAYPDGALVIAPRLGLAPPNPEFLAPAASVSVTIGDLPATVLSAAAQPMRVSGMLQVTAQIPPGLAPGAQPLVLKIGESGNAAQKVTVWVR